MPTAAIKKLQANFTQVDIFLRMLLRAISNYHLAHLQGTRLQQYSLDLSNIKKTKSSIKEKQYLIEKCAELPNDRVICIFEMCAFSEKHLQEKKIASERFKSLSSYQLSSKAPLYFPAFAC